MARGRRGNMSMKRREAESESLQSVRTQLHPCKPPYTYQGMIAAALLLSPAGELSLNNLYQQLQHMFHFFSGSYRGWRESVRHNLTRYPCFHRRPNPLSPRGRKQPWRVDLSMVRPCSFLRQITPQAPTFPETLQEYIEQNYGVKWAELEKRSVDSSKSDSNTTQEDIRALDTSKQNSKGLSIQKETGSGSLTGDTGWHTTMDDNSHSNLSQGLHVDVSEAMCPLPRYDMHSCGLLQIDWVHLVSLGECAKRRNKMVETEERLFNDGLGSSLNGSAAVIVRINPLNVLADVAATAQQLSS